MGASVLVVRATERDTGAYSAGLWLGLLGILTWISGCIGYARAKGRSTIEGLVLSLFFVGGFIVLLLLPDRSEAAAS
jgi:hypothetical protein